MKDPEINFSFAVGNEALKFDDIRYVNAAGNNYSVTRLQFYLSSFRFETDNGKVYSIDDVHYIDARTGTGTTFSFPDLPAGTYRNLTFYIGLDAAHNVTGGLPNNIDNNNMAWPEPMGGGYHFLKLEGNFTDPAGTYGYAMHMGTNSTLVTIVLNHTFTFSTTSHTIRLEMNINEWFANPYTFDFNLDGNYTMGDSLAMSKLSANGVDVFKMK